VSSADNNSILIRDQFLRINGEEICFHRTEILESDPTNIAIVAEVTSEIGVLLDLINKPEQPRGIQIECIHKGNEAVASLELCTSVDFNLNGSGLVRFSCSNLRSVVTPGDYFEFQLPFVSFGAGDFETRITLGNRVQKISEYVVFNLEGCVWTLIRPSELDGNLYTGDDATRLQGMVVGDECLHLSLSEHAILRVKFSIGEDSAMEIASRVCWLLSLALAQQVTWNELYVRSSSTTRLVCQRAVASASRVSASAPIRNWANHATKNFLERAYPIYMEDEKWWRETLNWFSIAATYGALESSSMIFCMLFDRISSRLLTGHKFQKQIGDDLDAYLESDETKDCLAEEFNRILSEVSPSWNIDRSKALVAEVKKWNDSPPYAKKSAIAFGLLDLKAPDAKMLKRRNRLMHDGGLNLDSPEAIEFLLDLNEQILVVLLAMLKFDGTFFMAGRGNQETIAFKST